jgi:hypothetical protein
MQHRNDKRSPIPEKVVFCADNLGDFYNRHGGLAFSKLDRRLEADYSTSHVGHEPEAGYF